MKALYTLLIFGAALLVLPHSPARAEVYKYTDKKGRVHYTDDPDKLPEPQRSKALKELEERINKKKERRTNREELELELEVNNERLPTQLHQKDSGPHPATNRLQQREASRKSWGERGKKAREKVAELEEKCAKLKTERDRNKTDSLTFSRPGAGQRYQESQAAYQKCQEDLKKARNYLQAELPEQARKAGIPPGWIR